MMGTKLIAIPGNARTEFTVDMEKYPTGIYMYQVVLENDRIYTGKLVKE